MSILVSEKEAVIYDIMNKLNLMYKVDKDAFEFITRSDRMVDSITSLEGKTRYFELACQKDPVNSYVRQHYARMLLRENKHELALGEIEAALKINPNIRSLYHTKGVVLMQLAFSLDSIEIARRRMAQSEANFKKCINMYARDEYGYQALAQLYIGWARKINTEDEIADYISKAESIIGEGLKMVNVRDGLYIESSNIQDMLGNQPKYIKALETAVTVNTTSNIARYLLGRAYRKQRRYKDALKVLEYTIKNYMEEFRSFVEYALCLIYSKEPYNKAISILKLSTLYGLSDPRFIATLGGLLMLNKQFSESKGIFDESLKKNFTAEEMNKIQFIPPDPSDTDEELRLEGRVVKVKAGYCLIESADYPSFLLTGSKYNNIVIREGMYVTFVPGFSARGRQALRPQEIK